MKKLTSTFLLSIVAKLLIAQGCSDAGFCSIGAIKSGYSKNEFKQKLSIGTAHGIGDEGVYVLSPYVQYDNQLAKNFAIQSKVTSNYASGKLGSAFGAGDVFLTAVYKQPLKNKWNASYILSVKAPLGSSNAKQDNKPLPMQYQSTLGTFDAIAGVSINNDKWQVATALQMPLSGANGNEFSPLNWTGGEASKFPPSFKLKRKPDVLLRANYSFKETDKWKFNAGLLSIFHLGTDTYEQLGNKDTEIKGSDGLTLNATLNAVYKLNNKINLELLAGAPMVVRDTRPDGLTRAFSITTEINFRF